MGIPWLAKGAYTCFWSSELSWKTPSTANGSKFQVRLSGLRKQSSDGVNKKKLVTVISQSCDPLGTRNETHQYDYCSAFLARNNFLRKLQDVLLKK